MVNNQFVLIGLSVVTIVCIYTIYQNFAKSNQVRDLHERMNSLETVVGKHIEELKQSINGLSTSVYNQQISTPPSNYNQDLNLTNTMQDINTREEIMNQFNNSIENQVNNSNLSSNLNEEYKNFKQTNRNVFTDLSTTGLEEVNINYNNNTLIGGNPQKENIIVDNTDNTDNTDNSENDWIESPFVEMNNQPNNDIIAPELVVHNNNVDIPEPAMVNDTNIFLIFLYTQHKVLHFQV